MTRKSLPIALLASLAIMSCSKRPGEVRNYPLNTLDGVIAQSGVSLDKSVSADGRGSLRVDVSEATTVPLFDITDLRIDNADLTFRARVRTDRIIGQAYLEMVCHFPGRGDVFSRGQATLLAGTNDWTNQETSLALQRGEMPDTIKLNIVVNGRGTVWIDDVSLLKGKVGN